MKRLAVIAVLAACAGPKPQTQTGLSDPASGGDRDMRFDLVAELQDEIIKAYERDEPPETETAMLLPEIGSTRIGVGPGDVLIRNELLRAPSRWPLDASMPTEPRSKRLVIHLAKDRTAAWVSDEISWRLKLCGRTAVIPLRMTALYARDGDRWVLVFEHTSFARTPTPTRAGQKLPRSIKTAIASRDLADELSGVLGPVLRRSLDKSPKAISTTGDATMLGADVAAEWHGEDVLQAKLVPGTGAMRLEDRRVGTVGRSGGRSTIAYWIGNLTVDLPARPGIAAGLGHFRGSFTFERRDNAWVIVQGHLSHAIEDGELASAVFGTALISPKPLSITCDEAPKVPEVAPKPRARGAGTP
jgi:hypothetical protein